MIKLSMKASSWRTLIVLGKCTTLAGPVTCFRTPARFIKFEGEKKKTLLKFVTRRPRIGLWSMLAAAVLDAIKKDNSNREAAVELC